MGSIYDRNMDENIGKMRQEIADDTRKDRRIAVATLVVAGLTLLTTIAALLVAL